MASKNLHFQYGATEQPMGKGGTLYACKSACTRNLCEGTDQISSNLLEVSTSVLPPYACVGPVFEHSDAEAHAEASLRKQTYKISC